MARKLKTYTATIGFYDLAVAAPSMKAALDAWGAGSNLFHQGIAEATDDPDIVAATLAKPGVVLKRPAGSSGGFAEHSGLPDLDDKGGGPRKRRNPQPKRRAVHKGSEKDARKAAADFAREQKRRGAEQRREEAAREKERAKREKLVAKARTALETAQRDHERRAGTLEAERAALERKLESEETRWQREKERLTSALRRAQA